MNMIPALINNLKLAGISAVPENNGLMVKDMLGLQIKVNLTDENLPMYGVNFRKWPMWVIYPGINLENNLRWVAIMGNIFSILLLIMVREFSFESSWWVWLICILLFASIFNLLVLSIIVSRYNLIVGIISRSLGSSNVE